MRTLPRPCWLLALVVVSGCSNVPFEERGKITQAVFDPSTGDIPTPNDLAMKNGQVAIDENPLLSVAENALKMSLNGRDGFSTGSSARVRFTDQLSAASLSDDTVFTLDLGVDGKGAPKKLSLQNSYAECDASLSIVNPSGFEPGHTYLFAIRGGAEGVKDAQGNEIAAMPAFHMLRAGKDLREHLDAMPGKTRADKAATAEKLEAIREKYEPLFQVLEANGLPRREVAILWTFSTTKQGEVLFDPGSKRIPFPNELLKDPSTGLVSLPIAANESPESKTLKAGLSKLDGFSTSAALSLETTTAIDRNTVLDAQTVRLFATNADGSVTEKLDFTTKVTPDGKKLWVQPTTPLRPGTRYSLLLAGVKDVQGRLLSTMPLQGLLVSPHALVDEKGETTISSICAATAKRLEPLRQTIAPAIEKLGGDRSRISAAYTFTTQDIEKRVQEMYLAPYKANLPLTLSNVVSGSPWDRGYGITMPSVAKIITGRMTTIEFLDPTTRAFRDSGVGTQKEVELVMTIPTGLQAGASVPVIVFGHGLMTDRRLSLVVANRLSSMGYATVAIDFPYHGERTVCMESADCAGGAACNKDGTCAGGADLARQPNANWMFDLVGLEGNGKATPTATGKAFIDVPNLLGSRDHFRQALADMSALTRLLKNMDWKPITGGFSLDTTPINYVGISLGGIMGSSLSGMDPAYDRMLLNVPGAGLVDLMQESTLFSIPLESGLAEKGINKGTPEMDAFVNAAKWVLDEVDPINISQFGMKFPLKYVDPATNEVKTGAAKRLRIQMASGDAIVPNASSYRLRDVALTNPSTQFKSFVHPLNHGMLGDPIGAPQDDMADFLGGN